MTGAQGLRLSRRTCGLLVMALVVLAACSKEKDVEPPSELVKFTQTLKVDRLWSASVSGDKPVLRLGLGLAVDGGRVYAAGYGGDVVALELASGKSAWRTRTKAKLAGGTGAGFGLVVVGSSDGEVIALGATDGKELWRVRVGGEVLSGPAVAERAVLVRTVDGRLYGLSRDDGHELWREEQQIPRLTLRGTARPVVSGDVALCGFDNGRVLAVNIADGAILWDAAVAPPRGRTELERLVDIDSAVKVAGADVFVVGFQGRAAMLALDSGQVWWSRELSSYRGLDINDDAVFTATTDGELVSMRRRTGVEIWRQSALKRRGLSAPTVVGGSVVVGDFEGELHWFDAETGTLQARVSAGGRISNAPVAVGDTLLVVDDSGKISAFRPQAARAAAAPAATPAPAVTPAAPAAVPAATAPGG
jgi:outer membrane protein assembly factor BamB